MSGDPIIVFDKVTLSVEGRRFLHRADLEVSEGETLVVAGPPGCGKSFVLRLVLGLPGMARETVRFEGEVFVDGRSVFDESPQGLQRLRRRLGCVLRGGGLIENMDIRRNVALPLNYHYRDVMGAGDIDARCDALFRDMGLVDRAVAGLRPVLLNREERTYVALARALVNQPHILLLDEPTSGLSPDAAERLARFCFYYQPEFSPAPAPVEDSAGKPMTRIVTAVDLQRYLDFGHRFAVLADERVQIVGDHEAVLSSSDPKVQRLMSPSARTGRRGDKPGMGVGGVDGREAETRADTVKTVK